MRLIFLALFVFFKKIGDVSLNNVFNKLMIIYKMSFKGTNEKEDIEIVRKSKKKFCD
jgi:hypothetical protein